MAVTLETVLVDSRKFYEGSILRVRCSSADGWKDIGRFKQNYLQGYRKLLVDVIYDTMLPKELRSEAWNFYSSLFHRNHPQVSDLPELTAQDMDDMSYFQNKVLGQYASLGRIKRYSFTRDTQSGPILGGELVEWDKIGTVDVIKVQTQERVPPRDNVVELRYKL